jgi:hypothetical protein
MWDSRLHLETGLLENSFLDTQVYFTPRNIVIPFDNDGQRCLLEMCTVIVSRLVQGYLVFQTLVIHGNCASPGTFSV